MEKRSRSLAKTITWRLMASLLTMLLVFFFTGNLVVTAGVGSGDFVLKLVFYYVHERIWNRISVGRERASRADET